MFKEIYDKSIENIPSNRIPAGFFEERPIMVTGMISPETEIEIQAPNGNKVMDVALYPMNASEFERFKAGESINLKSIYELNGYNVVGPKRYYGNGHVIEKQQTM